MKENSSFHTREKLFRFTADVKAAKHKEYQVLIGLLQLYDVLEGQAEKNQLYR